MGRELLICAAPELIDVAIKKKSPKEAMKNTVTKTARKQFGGGRRHQKTPNEWTTKNRVSRGSKNIHSKKNQTSEKSSRFFLKQKNDH